jgi:endonuclease/exonuclease/phosphatase family metal-dependent hydrolase
MFRMRRRTGRGIVFATILLACCNGDDDDQSRIATFNLGLAFGYVPEASARIDPIIEALEASAFDLVCLQELWVDQDESGEWTTDVIDRVLEGVSDTYPHSHWSRTRVPDDAPEVGCTTDEADMLLGCAEPACGDEPPDNLATCVLANCDEEFQSTSSACQTCLVTNLGRPLDEIAEACRGVTRGGVVYDGHNGLAIISKHPLESTGILELDYVLTARSALYATVDLPGAGPTDVYCTHIAADLSEEIAYPEDAAFSSFAEENADQTARILEHAEQSTSAPNVALLGDFNHGPAVGEYRAELPANYRMVVDATYESPVTQLDPPRCTFCDDNILVGRTGPGGKIIDHIYLRLGQGVRWEDAAIIYDEPVEITGADGERREVHLSDHYGVAVTLTR